MKTVVAILLAALVGFGGAWYWLSRQQQNKGTAEAAHEAGWQQEKAYLEQALAEARKKQVEVRSVTRTVATTVTNRLNAAEILEKLVKLRPEDSDDSRNRAMRQIIYHLQMLVELGDTGLPVIRDFLKQNKDVDYVNDVINAAGEHIRRGSSTSFASRQATQTDFFMPPSLRLGLIDVLDQIGGEQAQGILAEQLDTTGRAIEVAYIARVLQEEAPDKYRDNALKAAKELLVSPPAIDQPNRFDENAKAYLFQVLAMYNDTSFAKNAQTLLIAPDGRVDKQALTYLNNVLKEQAVPALALAYQNPQLTNQTERAALFSALLNFAGASPQANQMLKEFVASDDRPAAIRAYTIQGLAGGSGREQPRDANLIQGRLQLLKTLRETMKDERILRTIDDTKASLERLLEAAKSGE